MKAMINEFCTRFMNLETRVMKTRQFSPPKHDVFKFIQFNCFMSVFNT